MADATTATPAVPSPTPSRPPGLRLAARLALSAPPIVRLVVQHLAADLRSHDPLARHAYYPTLCAVALVSRVFLPAARAQIQRLLRFEGGTAQLEKWLYAVEQAGEEAGSWRHEQVFFQDLQPFAFIDEDEEEGEEEKREKWSRPVLKRVFATLRDTKELWLLLDWTKDVAADLLEGKNWKDLTHLQLSVPLSGTRPKYAFQLTGFRPIDSPGRQLSDRDWSSTFTSLAPALKSLTELDFSSFTSQPYEPLFFPALFPLASSLVALELPSLTINPSTWRLALFAAGCKSLKSLTFHDPKGDALGELLPLFSTSPLKHLHLDGLSVPLGAGLFVHRHLLAFPDPFKALTDALEEWPAKKDGGLIHLVLSGIRAKGPLGMVSAARLPTLAKDRGWMLSLVKDEEYDAQLSQEEEIDLAAIKAAHAALFSNMPPGKFLQFELAQTQLELQGSMLSAMLQARGRIDIAPEEKGSEGVMRFSFGDK
ncbi:hypothetical protein JCM10213_008184 [Rhodosporidiobolus nylandii]